MTSKFTKLLAGAIFALLSILFGLSFESKAQTIVTFGTGTLTTGTTTLSPVNIYYRSARMQIVYPAADIIAAGVTGAQLIDSLAWDVIGVPIYAMPNYTIKMKNTASTALTAHDDVGLTTVLTGITYAPVASSFTDFLVFASPFFWDGVSNILIDVCFEQVTAWNSSGTVRYTSVPNTIRYVRADGANQCPLLTGTSESNRPNAKMSFRPAPACADPVAAGTVSGPDTICPSQPFMLSALGFTTGVSGLSYQWESAAAAAGPYTAIPGAVTPTLSVAGITTPTFYRFSVTCGGGAASYTASHDVQLNMWYDCYCTPVYIYGCSGGARINDFSTTTAITNISNLGTGCASGALGYTNYSATHSASAMQFQTISQTTAITSWGGGVKIWIDYNQNGVFGDIVEELVASSAGIIAAGSSFTSSFTIPLTAIPGETRMRVRVVESSTDFDPCSEGYYGETEDYAFTVIQAISCADPSITFPSTVTSNASPENVCGTGDITLTLTATMPLATGITYQWQSSPNPTGPWTNLGTPSISSPYFHPGVSANTYFRCNIMCEGTNEMYSSVILVESVTPELPVLAEGEHCGPGSVTLTGTVGSGNIFWFENPTGGVPFASGTTVETPPIDVTTTFYAAGGAFPPAVIQVGDASTVTSGTTAGPYNLWYRRSTMQMMYKADQLAAEGAIAGLIDELRFKLTGLPSFSFPDYTISIKMVPASSMTTLTWQTSGFTQIFGGTGFTYSPSAIGWQSYPFTPMFWDGASHIIVQVCWSYAAGISSTGGTHEYTSTSGQMLYSWTDATGSSCGLTGTSASTYLPNAIFNFTGCASERVPVVAHIRDTPTIHIDVEDGEYCLFNNTFDIPTSPAQPAGSTFMWNTGDTDSFARVSTDGTPTTFWVEVTNEWGCTNADSVNLTLKPSPEVDLGADTLVCEGGVVTLDAGSGHTNHYWNTGATTRQITVDDGGLYSVLVENEFGCLATDTINVTIEGFAPTVDGIIVDNLGAYTFQFTPFHPMHILNYHWSFGDGNTSVSVNPMHTYDSSGTYLVTLTVESTCGKRAYTTYTTIVQSVDEYEFSQNHLKLYPNPTNSILNIESIGNIKMNKLTIVNMLGQEVYVQEMNKVELFQLDVSRFANGAYHVVIESDKGRMTKKFQILK